MHKTKSKKKGYIKNHIVLSFKIKSIQKKICISMYFGL
jgi:hypothetical protein